MFLVSALLSSYGALAFAADNDGGIKAYERAIEQMGVSPLASRLQEKLATDSLEVGDVQEILKEGTFPFSKKSPHGLKKVSEGKEITQRGHRATFAEKSFLITYFSRSLGPKMTIPEGATVKFLKETKPDSISKEYEYSLMAHNGDVYNFSLTLKKVAEQSADKVKKSRFDQELSGATKFVRPPSVHFGALPQDIQEEAEKAQEIEDYIAQSKAERRSEDEKRHSVESDSQSDSSEKPRKSLPRQRSYSALASKAVRSTPEIDTKASSSETSMSKVEEPKHVSFAMPDLDSLRTKKEAKVADKQINLRSAYAQSRSASTTTLIDAKAIAKAAKKAQKEREKASKSKEKEKKK